MISRKANKDWRQQPQILIQLHITTRQSLPIIHMGNTNSLTKHMFPIFSRAGKDCG
jgi:hypothetical protein